MKLIYTGSLMNRLIGEAARGEGESMDHEEPPEIFADGVLDVGFGNGMVRIDLFSLSATRRGPDGQPAPAVRQRVVMSLPGFLNSLRALEGMRRRLEDAGVIPAGEFGPAPAQGGPASPQNPEQPPQPRSPNFR